MTCKLGIAGSCSTTESMHGAWSLGSWPLAQRSWAETMVRIQSPFAANRPGHPGDKIRFHWAGRNKLSHMSTANSSISKAVVIITIILITQAAWSISFPYPYKSTLKYLKSPWLGHQESTRKSYSKSFHHPPWRAGIVARHHRWCRTPCSRAWMRRIRPSHLHRRGVEP